MSARILALFLLLLAAAPAGAQGLQVTRKHDANGRLTQMSWPSGRTLTFEYDPWGNLLQKKVLASAPGGGGGGSSGKCFVATAAYGTPMHPHVQTLRDFRDAHLLGHAPGRALVGLYERTSPPLAAFIAERPLARGVARALLAPLVYGVAYPLPALGLVLLAAGLALRRRSVRRARAAAA